jgi:hypothetical protein
MGGLEAEAAEGAGPPTQPNCTKKSALGRQLAQANYRAALGTTMPGSSRSPGKSYALLWRCSGLISRLISSIRLADDHPPGLRLLVAGIGIRAIFI